MNHSERGTIRFLEGDDDDDVVNVVDVVGPEVDFGYGSFGLEKEEVEIPMDGWSGRPGREREVVPVSMA